MLAPGVRSPGLDSRRNPCPQKRQRGDVPYVLTKCSAKCMLPKLVERRQPGGGGDLSVATIAHKKITWLLGLVA